jgi:hypothetical protein
LDEERGSGAALGGIFPLDAGWLRPSEFEGRRRSAPVSALPFLLSRFSPSREDHEGKEWMARSAPGSPWRGGDLKGP